MWRWLPAAVLTELAFDVYMFVEAIRHDIAPNVSSSVVRFLLMGTLGGLAVFRGLRWARRLFSGLLYFGAVGLSFASFFPLPIIGAPSVGLHFAPELLALAAANILVALAATVGGRATEARFAAGRSAH